MGATTSNYVVISADCHGGASISGYKPYLATSLHEEFDAWASSFVNPYDDNTNADADRNWSSERRLREMEADGVIAEVLLTVSGQRVLLVAGEVDESLRDELILRRFDESVLVFPDAAASRPHDVASTSARRVAGRRSV